MHHLILLLDRVVPVVLLGDFILQNSQQAHIPIERTGDEKVLVQETFDRPHFILVDLDNVSELEGGVVETERAVLVRDNMPVGAPGDVGHLRVRGFGDALAGATSEIPHSEAAILAHRVDRGVLDLDGVDVRCMSSHRQELPCLLYVKCLDESILCT